jgi:hypothetical protein
MLPTNCPRAPRGFNIRFECDLAFSTVENQFFGRGASATPREYANV